MRLSEIGDTDNVDFWVNYMFKKMEGCISPTGRPTVVWKAIESGVKNQVSSFIHQASKNWHRADQDRGVIDVLYRQHTGHEPQQYLLDLWQYVLDENLKLFNGISKDDVAKVDNLLDVFVCPGWKNVSWVWWDFDYVQTEDNEEESFLEPTLMVKVRMAEQIRQGTLKEFHAQLQELELKKVVLEGDVSGTPDFIDSNARKEYNALVRKIENVKKEFAFLDKNNVTVRKEPETVSKIAEEDMTLF